MRGLSPSQKHALTFFCLVGITPNFSEFCVLYFRFYIFQIYLKEYVLVAVTISIQIKCPGPIVFCLNNYVKSYLKKKKKSYEVCLLFRRFLAIRLAYMP